MASSSSGLRIPSSLYRHQGTGRSARPFSLLFSSVEVLTSQMGEETSRVNGLASGLTSGLAVLLNGADKNPQKNRLVSCHDDLGHQSLERTLENIFDLPFKSIGPLNCSIDTSVARSIINKHFFKYHVHSAVSTQNRDGISMVGDNSCSGVTVDESSISGDLRIIKPPSLVKSLAIFSSVRANACVWKGKWMYEVILETAGIQQLGWATLSCPFTDRMGVGDAEDSYAYDGKRVKKWNEEEGSYGQPWVPGDVIGCCLDLDNDIILFYRNGISLGVAFLGLRKMGPGLGYFPAVSLSHGEKCDLNFGGRPFKFPIEGFLPLQDPPPGYGLASQLLQCMSRLLEVQPQTERAELTSVEKFRRLKRFVPVEDIFQPIANAICEEFFSILDKEVECTEYVYGVQAPHDHKSLDKVLDIFLKFKRSVPLFQHLLGALSCYCKTASLVLTECPYSGSYPYLALVCYILRREDMMVLWWRSSEFEFLFEGFLSRKSPNKYDLQLMLPSVWWPNSYEDMSQESSMLLITTALSGAIDKIEEKHRDLCCLVIQFLPPATPHQLPGAVFRTFLQNLLLKNREDRNVSSPGVLSNPVLVSLYTVILYFLSEGFPNGLSKTWGVDANNNIGFLHRGGQQSFPVGLFLKNDPLRDDIARLGGSFSHLSRSHQTQDQDIEVISWEEGCMDDKDTRVTHCTRQKPCCCSSYDIDVSRFYCDPIRFSSRASRGQNTPIPERSAHVSTEYSDGSLSDEISDKPSSSDHSHSQFEFRPVQHTRIVPRDYNFSSAILREEELLDAMLLLYHMGLAPNYKQASYYMAHQSQSISLLEEVDKQLRERSCSEQQKRLKEARNIYREEVIDCVRQCTWYRISLFSRWKQRGMYAACMWTVHLLLVLSKEDDLFSFVPEFYLEALVDCFHVLRKSDPPFVPSAIFIKQGLSSFITFVVTHFNDLRITSADQRDLLLQSISVLVQYKEHLAAFEMNEAASRRMPKALLSAFDNRTCISVTNIIVRLCKGSGFGSSKRGESSSSSVLFPRLLRDACMEDQELFSSFLNQLFNTLSWAMTEFSALEFQQRKCCVVFDLSCNLARILEFYTREIPQAFVLGTDMNLRRLTELVVFILNQMTSTTDSDFFDLSIRRQGHSLEKVNRGMILAPLVGIVVNLLDARAASDGSQQNDVVGLFASMYCPDTVCGFQCMLEYNWADSCKGNVHVVKLRQLEEFLSLLIIQLASSEPESSGARGLEQEADSEEDRTCCICYASDADAQFMPCLHKSCYGCITRHLLNGKRCFFCNATVLGVTKLSQETA
ncbi:hypothetical protein V2J09_002276 [Rumex salicifolius]